MEPHDGAEVVGRAGRRLRAPRAVRRRLGRPAARGAVSGRRDPAASAVPPGGVAGGGPARPAGRVRPRSAPPGPGGGVPMIPAPVARWRNRALADPRRGTRTAAVLGIALGACFTICFLTGLLSHLIQHPPSWFAWPARPAGLYRVTQGLHVATGIAAIPLLLAKLWAVYPRLFQTPAVRDVAHALER